MKTQTIMEMDAFCCNVVLKELKAAGLTPKDERYVQISKATAKLLIRSRKEIWTRYLLSKEGLKDWILWKVGMKENQAYEKIQHMGLTGDVLHDMEVIGCKKDFPMQWDKRQRFSMKENGEKERLWKGTDSGTV